MAPRAQCDDAPCLVFDFDGTVADSLTEVLAAYNRAAAWLRVTRISPDDTARLRALRPPEVLRELAIPLWKVPLVVGAVRRGMRKRMDTLQPFPGVVVALRALCQSGAHCTLLSSNSRDNIERFLDRHRIAELERLECGASAFGKAARLRRLLRHMPAAPGEAFYIGDEVRDISAARDAGLRSVAVTWGYNDRTALEAERPDFLIESPVQLLSLIEPARPSPGFAAVR
jgi:phosphoglycolate phosphatase